MSLPRLFKTLEYGPAPEGPKPALDWLKEHQSTFGHFIAGEFTTPQETFPSFNPATGEELAQIAQGTAADVDRAVKAALAALPEWQKLGPQKRARYLYALARGIQKHSRLFAVLETLDNGKPIRETRDLDIPLVARHFYHHAGWSLAAEREFPGYEAAGVCGQIIPWNFPLLMLSWKIAPALAAGCTVVLKPAEFTSLTALRFAELCAEVGLPAGVVNIITGDGSTGAALVEHPEVDKIAFTGSTEVGRILRKATAGTGKKLSLELGGKSPFIVFEDADLDSAVEGIVDAIWFNQGQVCCAGSRLLVQESIQEKFLTKLKKRMETLRVGDPLDKAIDMGAIVDSVQLQRIDELVAVGVKEGAEKFQSPCPLPAKGWFYPPTLLSPVEPSATVAQVEIFGPVLVAMPFRTPAEAVELANNTVYGLAASVWTENLGLAHQTASQVKAGTIWINCTNLFDASSGFGGYRESGFGREGGQEGLLEYLKPKKVTPEPLPEAKPSESPEAIDRTHKLYIGGKQARPDGGYSLQVGPHEIARANRKDLRNAVEAARNAQPAWQKAGAHARSQVLYYWAENLAATEPMHVSPEEHQATIEALFEIAAWADKFEGRVHPVPMRGLVYALPEPWGVVGVVCDDAEPLFGLVVPIAAALAMGNAVVALGSEANPLPTAELYRVLETSDVPGGVVNLLTGLRSEVVPSLADHDGVECVWCFDSGSVSDVETRAAGNLKAVWGLGRSPRGLDPRELLRRATQWKNVWTPYGE